MLVKLKTKDKCPIVLLLVSQQRPISGRIDTLLCYFNVSSLGLLALGQAARGIIRDIAEGMAFLHRKKTWHGDLKSLNVLLDADNRAKVRLPY